MSAIPPRIPFTPPTASINRVQIVDLPGIAIDAQVRGQKAYHLLSALSVVSYARAQADALKLPADCCDPPPESPHVRRQLPRHVDNCLSSPDKTVRATAQNIARRLGRNLGHIAVTLHRGDPLNRTARPDWTDAEWDHWAGIRQLWIGGGLVSGDLGTHIIQHAQAFLHETGYAQALNIARSPYPRNMGLIGAARYLPAATTSAVCIDFGQTAVKRAIVNLQNGSLSSLTPLTNTDVAWSWRNTPEAAQSISGAAVGDFVADIITQTLKESRKKGHRPGADIMLCIAAYVHDGELLGNGIYARMSSLSKDVRPGLVTAVRERGGGAVRLHLVHDGTAAAALHAGEAHSAVLVIGTAIGVGFPPSQTGELRGLAFSSAA